MNRISRREQGTGNRWLRIIPWTVGVVVAALTVVVLLFPSAVGQARPSSGPGAGIEIVPADTNRPLPRAWVWSPPVVRFDDMYMQAR